MSGHDFWRGLVAIVTNKDAWLLILAMSPAAIYLAWLLTVVH
jgi:hypothetical protein